MFSKLMVKREAWCLTFWGKGLCVCLFLGSLITLVTSAGPFLSVNRPIPAEVLVVEGWLPDYALEDAVKEFQRGGYHYIITAGSPLLTGYHISDVKTTADMAAATMIRLGVKSNLVIAVPGPQVLRGRSLAHARAVHDWIKRRDCSVKSVNIYTLGVHARRSRLLFAKVLGPDIRVGTISHSDAAYDLDRWWCSSEGFKTVTEELIGYVWTRLDPHNLESL